MGIAAVKARDPIVAARLQLWLDHTLENFEERILAVDQAIALEWGLGSAPVSRAPMDELLAATAKVHGMTLVSRNVKDIEHTGVSPVEPIH